MKSAVHNSDMVKKSRNQRIIYPLEQAYTGKYQFVFTGNIDDYFVLSNAFGRDSAFFSLKNALKRYAINEHYDLIISLDEKIELSFETPEMEALFEAKAQGNSRDLVDSGLETTTFVPHKKTENSDSTANKRAEVQKTTEAVAQNTAQNKLDKITKVLQDPSLRVFVIFDQPERLASTNRDSGFIKKIETISIDWRNLAGHGHPRSRSVLIINPSRVEEFLQTMNHYSSLHHMYELVTIGTADKEEYSLWLKNNYLRKNHIAYSKSALDRVVLAGLAKGNLYNFIAWIQDFFVDGEHHKLSEILDNDTGDTVESKEDLLKRLDSMIGLREVKTAIKNILSVAETDKDAFATSNYTMMFLGNPGTGKTVIAELVAKLFWAIELRRKPTVVTLTMNQIQSGFNEGDVIVKMNEIIKEAMGGVLFIDEVYEFAENEWGKNAFKTLLTEIENNRADLTVIMAGYEEKLPEILRINPGFDSRIPDRFRIHFPDYTPDEKVDIFKLMMKNKDLSLRLQPEAESKLRRVLKNKSGNGRGVRDVFEDVCSRLRGATEITDSMIRDPRDINKNEISVFIQEIENSFVGMQPLKDSIQRYLNTVSFMILRERSLNLPQGSMLIAPRLRFTGAPGTGKTSIARRMAKLFKALGLIDSARICDIPASSLKGSHIGEAQKNVSELFADHRGELLFLDEVYSLYSPSENMGDSYSKEVIDTFVQCLTVPENNRTAVIVAGYKEEVDEFLTSNRGLKSRLDQEIFFPSYTPEECYEIFEKYAHNEMYELENVTSFKKRIVQFFSKECLRDNFANARDVRNIFNATTGNLAQRVMNSKSSAPNYQLILEEDFPQLSE